MFYPRLETSINWTPLPAEYCEKVRQSLAEAFQDQFGQLKFIAEGRIYPKEIIVRLGFKEKERLVQSNFEVSLETETKMPIQKQLDLCADAAFDIAEQFLPNIFSSSDLKDPLAEKASGEGDLPLQWTEIAFKKKAVYFQFSRANSELEAEADRLLGIDNGQLYNLNDDLTDVDFEDLDVDDLDIDEKKFH